MSGPRKRDDAFARVFGANLARCRERLGVSQEELGFRAGLHRTAVGQLERGERIARTDTLVRLCGSLGVGPEVLLAGLGWRPARMAVGELEIQEIEPAEISESAEAKPARSQERSEPKDKTASNSEGQE
jgi:transcriptional regulator with XRE-family HTH domain